MIHCMEAVGGGGGVQTASLLELYFNDSMQTVRARRRRQSRKRVRRWGRCSIYRHRSSDRVDSESASS